jgi:hypothetical protein
VRCPNVGSRRLGAAAFGDDDGRLRGYALSTAKDWATLHLANAYPVKARVQRSFSLVFKRALKMQAPRPPSM